MKSSLRKYAAEKRNQLSFQEAAQKSLYIQEKLYTLLEFIESEYILFYASIGKEVNTGPAIQKALALNKKVFLPLLASREEKNMLPAQVSAYPQDLEMGPFGIMQPKMAEPVSLDELDLVIMPGVGFDLSGNRLGYGGGYYDRFLEKRNKKTKLIAFAYEAQILGEIPNESYDIKVDKIITEQRIITINS